VLVSEDVVIELMRQRAGVERRLEGLTSVYAEAFGANSEVPSDRFASSLVRHAERDGFECAVALDAETPVAFAYAFTSFTGDPPSEWYRAVVEAAGENWIQGQCEVPWFAVLPAYQGRGIGTRLLEALIARRSEARAWLVTLADEAGLQAFYRRRGWCPLAEDSLLSDTPRLIMGRFLTTPDGAPRSG
jgi:GNAT superfamily N-acetyltransferase